MKKLVISFLCILFTSMLFAETEYSLREYFKNNILELDPIEGFYDVESGWIQYNPWGGVKRDVFNGTNMAIRRRIDNTFDYYNKKGEIVTYIYFTKITDGIYNCHFRVGGYQHTQRFTLDNGIMFNATHRVPDNKKEILFEGPVGSKVRVDFVFNGIKSYPTSAMYLEAAKEDARKAEQELQEAIEKAKREAGWSGTGFALNQGYIVTNYHVVEGANTIKVKGIKGDFNAEYNAKVITTDKVNDIAIIKIEDERFTSFGTIPYKIKKSMSEVGESVWALGYPMTAVMGEEIKFTDGKISSRTGVQGDLSMYQISVPIQPGNSGGPLFDNYGNIVGITSAGLNREEFNSENVNYAIKTSYLYNLLESTLTTSILPQGTAMNGQELTQKIKIAKNFVFCIMCSSKEGSTTIETNLSNSQPVSYNAKNNSFIIESPSRDYSNELDIVRVTVDSLYTIVDCKWFNYKYAGCSIHKDTYIQLSEMHIDKQYKMKLVQVKGIALKPSTTDVKLGDTLSFTLFFEPLPSETIKFDLIEPIDKGWEVRGIKIR